MSTEFKPIKEREVLTVGNLSMIQRAFPGVSGQVIDINKVDLDAGAGILEKGGKCIWTLEGKRITISMGSGTLIGSLSNEVDPDWQERRQK